jgi:hypothetical protein
MTNMARVISIIQLNMTKVHTVVGSGGQHGCYNALDYSKIKHRNAGPLGPLGYPILSVLSDRFLFEFTLLNLKVWIYLYYQTTGATAAV